MSPSEISQTDTRAHPPFMRHAIALSLTEIALGSIVHAFKIPFGGHALSLNEIAILTWSMRTAIQEPSLLEGRSFRRAAIHATSSVANAAAMLKSFSPAGSRLAPMLAISLQGLLYSLGVAALGANAVGAALGASLASLWGFAQPILITGVLYGKPFFEGLLKTWNEIARFFGLSSELILPILIGVVLAKVCLALGVALGVWFSNPESEAAYLNRLEQLAERAKTQSPKKADPLAPPLSPFRGALHDLLHWPFLLGAAISLGFFAGSGTQGAPEIVFYALRIFSIGLLLFWGLRAFPARWSHYFRQRFPNVSDWITETQRKLGR